MQRAVFTVVLAVGLILTTNFAYGAYGIEGEDEQRAYDFIAGKAEDSLKIVTGSGTKAQVGCANFSPMKTSLGSRSPGVCLAEWLGK